MTETYLRVPVVEAVEWGEWLEDELATAAQRAGVNYDGGEEEGEYEVHVFDGISAEQLEELVAEVLKPRGAQVKVTGASELTVTLPASSVWIKILNTIEHPYGKAVKSVAKEFSDSLSGWWAKSGRSRLLVQLSHDDGRPWLFENDGSDLFVAARVDLSIIDRLASKAEVEEVARANLQSVIDRVGEHLGVESN